MPQGSMLGPLSFFICINDLHLAIKYPEVHHFADDTNLLNFNSCVKLIKQTSQPWPKNLGKLVKCKKTFPKCW